MGANHIGILITLIGILIALTITRFAANHIGMRRPRVGTLLTRRTSTSNAVRAVAGATIMACFNRAAQHRFAMPTSVNR